MIADISKTVRFTPQAWERWKRLIGLSYCNSWADVVNRALEYWEKQLIGDGVLRSYEPTTSVQPPVLFDLSEPVGIPAAGIEVILAGKRKYCKRCTGLEVVNENGLCKLCEVIVNSNGALTTADKLPTPPATRSKPAKIPKTKPASPVPSAARKSKPTAAKARSAVAGKVKPAKSKRGGKS